MTEEKLLTIREVSQMLHISEKDVIDLSESGKIPAYKVGGVYLRFKREQVEKFRKQSSDDLVSIEKPPKEDTVKDRVKDFLYFHDFYLAAAVIMVVMLVVIFKG